MDVQEEVKKPSLVLISAKSEFAPGVRTARLMQLPYSSLPLTT